MMLTLKKIISYSIMLTMMMLISPSMATIPSIAFKNITRHFKPGKEAYSPTLGSTALGIGLVENLRFFGPFTPGSQADGTRDFAKDESSDPLWNVIKILFPSFSGTFGVDSQADTNFAKYVESPKVVALLLTYAHDVRTNPELKIDPIIDEILANIKIENKKVRGLRKRTLEPLLKNIKRAVEQEKTKENLYPQYTPEQMITAFFCYKFNTQTDIHNLIKELPEQIVDKSIPFPPTEDLLTETDIKTILTQDEKFNLDDFFGLGNASIFTSVIPYREGVSPLSNGQCQFYDRKTDQFINLDKAFPDCVEISGRHIGNLVLFNSLTRDFDLSHIIKLKKTIPTGSHAEQRIDHVIDFYQKQPVNLANAGNTQIRSWWNRVVGDLDAFQDEPIIKYRQGSNEIASGIINFINTYQKIFSLPLKPQPDETTAQKDKELWVGASFKTFLSALNPTHNYKINASQLKWDIEKKELFGPLEFTVSDYSKKELFKFTLNSVPKHTSIKDLKVLKSSLVEQEINNALLKHETIISTGIAESLRLLTPVLFNPPFKENLYTLFQSTLTDNDSKIRFINCVGYLVQEALIMEETTPSLKLMLGNVLKTLSFQDDHVLEEFSGIISLFFEDERLQKFKETLFKNVQGLWLEGPEEDQIDKNFSLFQNLKIFKSNRPVQLLPIHASLEFLDLRGLNIKELPSIEFLKNLKKLKLIKTELFNSLAFSENNSTLVELNLRGSGIKSLTGLACLKELKKLNLSKTDELPTLTFSENNSKLVELNLKNSAIQSVAGLGYLTELIKLDVSNSAIESLKEICFLEKLKILDVFKCRNLTKLEFSKNNSSLVDLRISHSAIEEFTGIDYLQKLTTLHLSSVPLKTLVFSSENTTLHTLNVDDSDIEKLDGLSHLKALIKLSLVRTYKLQTLLFSENNSTLKDLMLYESGFKKLMGLESLKELEEFEGAKCTNLKTLEFSKNNIKLKKVRLTLSGIEQLEGVDNLPGLTQLISESTPLKSLTFSENNSNLVNLYLNNSKIKMLRGLSYLTSLQDLELEDCKDLGEVNLENCNNLKSARISKKIKVTGAPSNFSLRSHRYDNDDNIVFTH